ncbi:MAG: hypothetical protein ACI4WM_07980 [Erysipelotrichaceae bacterium]
MASKNRKQKSKYALSTLTGRKLDKYADFSLDDTIKNIICDIGIQQVLLKEVIPETMSLDTDKIKKLLYTDENEQILLLNSTFKEHDKTERRADFVYRFYHNNKYYYINIEAQRYMLKDEQLVSKGEEYARRILLEEQDRKLHKKAHDLGRVKSVILNFASDDDSAELIYHGSGLSYMPGGPYTDFGYGHTEVIICNVKSDVSKHRNRFLKIICAIVKTNTTYDDKIKLLEELGVSISEEKREEIGKMCDYLEFIKNQGREESADIIKAKDKVINQKDEVIVEQKAQINAYKEDVATLCRHLNLSSEELENILLDRARQYV